MTEHKYQLKVDQVVPFLPEPVLHLPKSYGANLKGTGEGIRICIIDSGVPEHDAIINIADAVNFTDSDDERDSIGHATLISGIIAANKPDFMVGLAPECVLHYAKMVDDLGRVRFDSFVAAVLWGVIQECDIIVILMTTDVHYGALHDAIKKAYDSGICVLANGDENTYPGIYEEVLTCGEKGRLSLPCGPIYSTYIEQEYAQATGTSIATALGAGLCALLLERKIQANEDFRPIDIYDELTQLIGDKNG